MLFTMFFFTIFFNVCLVSQSPAEISALIKAFLKLCSYAILLRLVNLAPSI